jgi:hypothetical protein
VAKQQSNQLAALLPKSDGVAVMDVKRLTQEAMPQILSGKVQMLAQINAQLDSIKNQTGIDLRQFEQLAVGVDFKQTQPKKFDFEPVVLARGNVNLATLLSTAQTLAKGKFREEKVGGKTIYLFPVREILQANKPVGKTPQDEEKFNKMVQRVPVEMAAVAFDANTLAVGTTEKVRQALSGTNRVGAELLTLASRQPNAMVSFAANVPAGMSQMWNLDGGDPLGQTIDSIRLISGTVNMVGANTNVSLAAKTFKPEQSKDLEDTLTGLQSIGKGFLGGMKGGDREVYARLVESAKIARVADEVTINLTVTNNDLGTLLGKI